MNDNPTPVTHWKKLTNPHYAGSHDLQPGQELKVTFEKVVKEQVKTAEGTQECIVGYFKGASKPMILNKTNCKIITTVLGSPYIELWAGKSVIIYSAKVKAFGELIEALRIKNQKI
jgi:hypothetical protein